MRSITAVLCLAALALGLTSLAKAGRSATPQVNTRLLDFKVVPKPKAVAAGRVTFVATNAGKLEHELVVVKTPKDAAKLGRGDGTASEKGEVAEVEDIKPGKTKRLTVSLKPGHYVLLCNIGKHYGAGMYVNFNVK